jgi:hypothetical protein
LDKGAQPGRVAGIVQADKVLGKGRKLFLLGCGLAKAKGRKAKKEKQ